MNRRVTGLAAALGAAAALTLTGAPAATAADAAECGAKLSDWSTLGALGANLTTIDDNDYGLKKALIVTVGSKMLTKGVEFSEFDITLGEIMHQGQSISARSGGDEQAVWKLHSPICASVNPVEESRVTSAKLTITEYEGTSTTEITRGPLTGNVQSLLP
ncbi:hypothetical protein [Kineosporia babensis]|uniref:Secreted protein n=1 Tax=Kineosporia babensis TaxID=499548 RepID=A0A9X1NIV4_9ACTN|nr:hypothetical protein [Kineosporia babensis]MCD5315842.1 hypothetical protein [Kineosporia babensis]